MDLGGAHGHKNVPLGTTDDLSEEGGSPRAPESLAFTLFRLKLQTMFALTAKGALLPLVPARGPLN